MSNTNEPSADVVVGSVTAEPKADAAEPKSDGWENAYTKLGNMHRDKRLASTIGPALIFTTRNELDELYHGNDLANRLCRLPAVEMTREWVELDIDTGDATGKQDLDRQVCAAVDVLKAKTKVAEALTWSRLHGGAIIVMGCDDGQPMDQPLDLNRLRGVRYLTVYDRHELRIVARYLDPALDSYGEPAMYELVAPISMVNLVPLDGKPTGAMLPPISYGQRIHASRCLIFEGTLTSRTRKLTRNNGWADSIFVKLFDVLRAYDQSWTSAEQLMQDFSQAVIKIKGLAEMMATNGEDKVRERLEIMDTSRSILRALMLDAEFEDFERKPTPMTGLPELLDRWLHRVAAAAEMPISLLFGDSPGGLQGGGKVDMEYFYNLIHAKQEAELRPQLEKLFETIMASSEGPTKGQVPASWSFTFCPLWQMSDTDTATLRKTQAETDQIYINTGVISANEVGASRFGGDEYSLETSLDDDTRGLLDDANRAADAQGYAAPSAPGVPGAMPSAAVPPQQIANALAIIEAVAAGEIPRESAQALLEIAFQLSPEDAARMLPPAGFKAPVPPVTSPVGAPPKAA
jgi:phage-related protein (TIGR01555 family)